MNKIAYWERMGGFEPWLEGYCCSKCSYESPSPLVVCPNCNCEMEIEMSMVGGEDEIS